MCLAQNSFKLYYDKCMLVQLNARFGKYLINDTDAK